MSEQELIATEAPAAAEDDASEESSAPKQHVSLTEKVAIAQETAQRLFELLGAKMPTVECRADEDQVIVQLSDLDPALQPQGDTRVLESMQFILNKAINRYALRRTRLSIDADGFRRRRPEGLDKVAQALAQKVAKLGKAISVGPIGQGDLRFLTAQLSRSQGIHVLATGAPDRRRLVIAPGAAPVMVAQNPQPAVPGGQDGGDANGERRGRRRRRR